MGSSWARDYNCQDDYNDGEVGGGYVSGGKKNISNEEGLKSTRRKAKVTREPNLYRIVRGKKFK